MLPPSECQKRNCKHLGGFINEGEEEGMERVVCKAFPKGIPDEIAFGNNKHLKPFPGDNGIQFELKEKES